MTTRTNDSVPMCTVVAGVDGSASGARALRWAATRSLEVNGEVVAVHVLTFNREFSRDLSLHTVTTWRRALDKELTGAWTEPARTVGARVRTVLVEDDTVAAGLLRTAGAVNADLIVLGAHSRGGFTDRLLGTTTYVVTHRARTPVVIIPVDWQPRAA
jgi:nucleotide-binding universal stress UspA family protein